VLSIDSIRATLATCNCEVAEIVERAGHPPQYAPIPEGLAPQVQQGLAAVFPQGLYRHQAQAIQTGIAGTSFCIATPTASGKTAIFTSVVVDRLLKNPAERGIFLGRYDTKASQLVIKTFVDSSKLWEEELYALDKLNSTSEDKLAVSVMDLLAAGWIAHDDTHFRELLIDAWQTFGWTIQEWDDRPSKMDSAWI
jgi:hypothetical protein